VILSGTKAPPRGQRIAHAAQPKSARKIITAARRDDQHGEPKPHQLTQVPMNSSIAAEQQHDVSLICVGWHSNAPLDRFIRLKRLEAFRRTSQTENGSGAHMRGRE
jgi:hypothetical protein